ncbi:hypothetical protein ACFSJ3_11440 [Corallincola platygyrae]|uniref:Uncharacterized protein n=1 Tax=Corallincola platygyrae TaxID=1193278 RepID=A0ABW4XQP9_9GAMM
MFLYKCLGWCTTLLIMCSFPVSAESLSAQRIEQWLEAAPVVQDWSKRNLQYQRKDQHSSDITQISEVFTEQVNDSGDSSDQLTKALQPYGFKDVKAWSDTFERIMLAMGALQLKQNNVESTLRAALQQLEKDANIPAGTRDRLIQEYQAMLSTIETLKGVPDADIAAVEPFEPQLRAWLNSAKPK